MGDGPMSFVDRRDSPVQASSAHDFVLDIEELPQDREIGSEVVLAVDAETPVLKNVV